MNEETVLTLKRLNFKQVGNFFIGKIIISLRFRHGGEKITNLC